MPAIGAVGLLFAHGTVRVFGKVDRILHGCKFGDLRGEYCGSPLPSISPDNSGDVDAAAFRRGAAPAGFGVFQFSLISTSIRRGFAATFVGGASALTICSANTSAMQNDNYFFPLMDYSTLDRITFSRTIAKAIPTAVDRRNGVVYVDGS